MASFIGPSQTATLLALILFYCARVETASRVSREALDAPKKLNSRLGTLGKNYDLKKGIPFIQCYIGGGNNTDTPEEKQQRDCIAYRDFADRRLGCHSLYRAKPGYDLDNLPRDTPLNSSVFEFVKGDCWLAQTYSSDELCDEDKCVVDWRSGNSRLSGFIFCCCRSHMCNKKVEIGSIEALKRMDPPSGNYSKSSVIVSQERMPSYVLMGVFVLVSVGLICALIIGLAIPRARLALYKLKSSCWTFCHVLTMWNGRDEDEEEMKKDVDKFDPYGHNFPLVVKEDEENDTNEGLLYKIPKFTEQDVRIGEKLSHGRFGTVFKASLKRKDGSMEDVAVKAFSPDNFSSFDNEARIYSSLSDEYEKSACIGSVALTNGYWLLLTLYEMGNLEEYLKSATFTAVDAAQLTLSFMKGLDFLHKELGTGLKPTIVHRDLKSRNLLMTTHNSLVIADFGLAMTCCEGKMKLDSRHVQVGTHRYMSPEMLEGVSLCNAQAYKNSDMYSAGLILWEILNRTIIDTNNELPVLPAKLPFDDQLGSEEWMTRKEMECKLVDIVVKRRQRPLLRDAGDDKLMHELNRLVVDCWQHQMEARIPAACAVYRIDQRLRIDQGDCENTTVAHEPQ